MQRLSGVCRTYKEIPMIMESEKHVGLAIDGCFEILHSYLYHGWREHDVEFLPHAKTVAMPADLKRVVNEHPANPPNNGKFRVYRIVPDSTERPELQVQLAPTDYFTTYPIQQQLFKQILPDGSGGLVSPHEKYGKKFLDFGDHPLPNIVCLHIVVVLPDDRLVVSQRVRSSDGINWQHGRWSCSIEEQMTVKHGGNEKSREDRTFFDAVYAGCEEELGVTHDRVTEVRILSIVVDETYNVDPIALVRVVDANIDDIKGYCMMKARDGMNRELRRVEQINWDFASIVPILRYKPYSLAGEEVQPEDWHHTTRMRLLVSLFDRFGIEDSMEAITA